jgi:hypothetical protein
LVKGEISADTFEEWNRETRSKRLPERVKPKTLEIRSVPLEADREGRPAGSSRRTFANDRDLDIDLRVMF